MEWHSFDIFCFQFLQTTAHMNVASRQTVHMNPQPVMQLRNHHLTFVAVLFLKF